MIGTLIALFAGEKPFVCDHLNCKKSFAEQSSLKKHKITHSGKSK